MLVEGGFFYYGSFIYYYCGTFCVFGASLGASVVEDVVLFLFDYVSRLFSCISSSIFAKSSFSWFSLSCSPNL